MKKTLLRFNYKEELKHIKIEIEKRNAKIFGGQKF